ncbi:glycoside hydrolase family 3 N-terminal domain-containing protein [Arthrobacter agilis]|uniref:beta-xylosidase/alpha-l-arabinosidase n=1 Tax=Arthrobacter agilis TaxID=37921 RepID=UPI0023653B33|nr:glycoside hydrolase family 3 N-terminal domain-containing protein [Arthrobacter agilis]WDF32001.1 glycoside hydrolase family 3 N-terminal domain-containing protein [Arthrobacter agilis]
MSTTISTTTTPAWHDVTAPASDRVEALLTELTLEEKIAQLFGVWVGASSEGGDVAPHQNDMDDVVDLDALLPNGLGQLTRPFGSAPVDPALGALSLLRSQRRIAASNRFGIPAVAHEECLAGFATWGATAYPVPLAWGASFNPGLIERMSHRIGSDMRSVGIHQGLAPVLDVVRDARWGRVEETIGEDPYLIGTVGTAYVRGLEAAGIVATLKHFVGYSASKAGRNLAPVSVGPRELADVLLVPFEMVMREGKPRSVMHSYTDVDGVPSAADESLLTGVLRDTWGFDGTVMADYFGIAFLKMLHGVAGSWGEAAALALTAGVDVELPTVKTFGAPLTEAVRSGVLPEAIVDRALRRVLRQKVELGLLDPDWDATPEALRDVGVDNAEGIRGTIDLDSAANRAVAREIAEQSIVLVSNDGTLPLTAPRRIAVVGPTTDDPFAVLGCYSFPAHVGVQHPDTPLGIELPTLLDSLRIEFPEADIDYVPGTTIDGGETAGISAAVDAATRADVVIVALGDRAGLFGRGTSGEGCDVESLRLPGAQQDLLDAVLATSTPAVVTLLAGRPYALGSAVTGAAAIVQAFFAGEEGTAAVAGILSGRVNPSGRLPVSIPASEGTQPSTYLAAPLARSNGVSSIDPTAAFAFGHGIGYTTFDWSAGQHGPGTIGVDGTATLGLRLRNTGDRPGTEIVQIYVHDPVASVVRPVQRLVGFQRVDLKPGESVELSIHVPADVTSFTDRTGKRVVEPGEIVLALGASSTDLRITHSVQLSGEARVVGFDRAFHPIFDEIARTAP